VSARNTKGVEPLSLTLSQTPYRRTDNPNLIYKECINGFEESQEDPLPPKTGRGMDETSLIRKYLILLKYVGRIQVSVSKQLPHILMSRD